MEKFFVKFRTDGLDRNAQVTPDHKHSQFKVELAEEEPEPILLAQLATGGWEVSRKGAINLSDEELQNLENAIELKIKEIYEIKNILVLTDFSDTAMNAARYAAALTNQLKINSLILYHSYAPVNIPPTPFAPVPLQNIETPEASLEKIMNLKIDLEKIVAVQTKIEIYNNGKALQDAVGELSTKLDIGLIIAGTTGKSNLEKILIGSNTLHLAQECKAPLLMIPPQATFKPIKQIVFACDLKQVSDSIPTYAIKVFVRSIGAKLLILNVDQDEMHFNTDRIKEMATLHQLWDGEEPEYHYIDDNDTVHGIMKFADKYQAELVLTVPKVYGFFKSIFHSSTTKKLAYHTHLPLLLFKDEF